MLRDMGVRMDKLRTDSRALGGGEVFLAYPGEHADGRRYIDAAIKAGVGAVLWEREGFDWNEEWEVPNIPIAGLKQFAGRFADEVYGHPSEKLNVLAVTGTNGKTTCTQWLAQAYAQRGERAGVIGTLGIGYPDALQANPNTTPDSIVLHEALKRFVDEGAVAVAMEASSIGIEQGRLNGVHVRTALFTNLSRDHLDYHADMEAYAQAKIKLFRHPGLHHAVLNMDDVLGVRIAHLLEREGVARVAYSMTPGAGLRSGMEHYAEAHHIDVSPRGIAFDLVSSWGQGRVESDLLGRFNVANLLGVLGVLLVSGWPLEQALAAVPHFQPVAGRMQRTGGGAQPLAVIDYAHTPDALEKVLAALRDVARAQHGRLVCVFGCGGDRDRGKRPLMGEAVSRYADHAIVTSDNPRSEAPEAIVAEILPGLSIPHDIETDRRTAIRTAVTQSAPGDVILIAGKGHEPYQEIAGQRLPFSDFDEARRALAERRS
jgi:UDP-N-acetylmuramoyl-L-alanyl-D-glutamate--2,6-diaminopimelate ligase